MTARETPGLAFRCVLCVLCGPGAFFRLADAQTPGVLDRATVEIGISASELGGKVGIDGSAGSLGTDIDLSRDLDVAGRDSSRLLALRWRPFERHEFGARAQRYGRQGDKTINRDIVFDDEVFTINSRITGEINLDVWSVEYIGWVLANEQRALGLSVGALQYRLGLKLAAENLPGGAQTEPVDAQVRGDLPVAVLGAEYRERLGEHWRLVMRAAVFKAKINHIDGTVYDFNAGVEYALTEHATLALRYAGARLDAQTTRDDLTGRLHLDLTGLQAALIWRW